MRQIEKIRALINDEERNFGIADDESRLRKRIIRLERLLKKAKEERYDPMLLKHGRIRTKRKKSKRKRKSKRKSKKKKKHNNVYDEIKINAQCRKLRRLNRFCDRKGHMLNTKDHDKCKHVARKYDKKCKY